MTTNRISGTPPSEPNRNPDTKAHKEEGQKIKKVGEVDPDEQARKQNKFKTLMDDTANQKGPSKTTEDFKTPSPLDPKFYRSEAQSSAIPGADKAAIASPERDSTSQEMTEVSDITTGRTVRE